MRCPYCSSMLYPNRNGTFTCRDCDHIVDRDDEPEDD